jgi:hypothetical protein
MAIEVLDDILEELADKAGVYGSHPEINDVPFPMPTGVCPCRVCFMAGLRERIERAVEIENLLGRKARKTNG